MTESVMPWMLEEAKGKKALALRVLRVCCEAWDVMVMMLVGGLLRALDRWFVAFDRCFCWDSCVFLVDVKGKKPDVSFQNGLKLPILSSLNLGFGFKLGMEKGRTFHETAKK